MDAKAFRATILLHPVTVYRTHRFGKFIFRAPHRIKLNMHSHHRLCVKIARAALSLAVLRALYDSVIKRSFRT